MGCMFVFLLVYVCDVVMFFVFVVFFLYVEIGIVDLQLCMVVGELDSVILICVYLECIVCLDCVGLCLCVVIEFNFDVFKDVVQFDVEWCVGQLCGFLYGILVLFKDNIGVILMSIIVGLFVLEGFCFDDVFLVGCLCGVGVLILGKINFSEWVNFCFIWFIFGWSVCGGQICNFYCFSYNFCGFSSGSVVVVVVNFVLAVVGIEIDGSIVCFVVINGVVGLKLIVGLVSCEGIILIFFSQDIVGLMICSVVDVVVLFIVMVGCDDVDLVIVIMFGCVVYDYIL